MTSFFFEIIRKVINKAQNDDQKIIFDEYIDEILKNIKNTIITIFIKIKILLSMSSQKKRQAQLQDIIHAQQSKIYALKKQIDQKSIKQQVQANDAVLKLQAIIDEKQKHILFLKKQLQTFSSQYKQQNTLRISQQQYMSAESIQKLSKYKIKIAQLQKSVIQIQKKYEAKLFESRKQTQQWYNRCQIAQKNNKKIVQQQQNVHQFYRQAVHHMPQQQETLLWVDKLIEFMGKVTAVLNQQNKNRDQTITNVVKNIKDDLDSMGRNISQQETKIETNKQKFLQELKILVKQAHDDYEATLQANQQFWQNLSKSQQKQQKEEIHRLQNQLQRTVSQNSNEIQSLTDQLYKYQQQKKVLSIGYQQLKSTVQQRQQSHKEQIKFLKTQLQNCLQAQEVRQATFQSELNRVGQQMSNLVNRYSQRIQQPILNLFNKIKQQIAKLHQYYDHFIQNSLLQGQINSFHQNIVRYLKALNEKNSEKILLKKTVEEIKDYIIDQRVDQEFADQKQKLMYQLMVTKKHLQKTKNYCNQLQANSKQVSQISDLTHNLLLAEAQNQVLMLELSKKNEQNSKEKLVKIQQKLSLIHAYTVKEDSFVEDMAKCVAALNSTIINPFQKIQQLISQASQLNIQSKNVIQPAVMSSSDIKQKIAGYQLFLKSKDQHSQALVQNIMNLTKIVKESLQKNTVVRPKKPQQKNVIEKSRQYQSRALIQKKIKEVQTQRIKNRQEMLAKLRILQDKFKVIDQKINKKQQFNITKTTQNILKQIHQIWHSYSTKEKFKQLSKISDQAFKDAVSKLHQCMVDNEGLVKQVELLKSLKK